MNEIELDEEYRINVDRNTSKQYDVIRIKVESYDLAILNIHSIDEDAEIMSELETKYETVRSMKLKSSSK